MKNLAVVLTGFVWFFLIVLSSVLCCIKNGFERNEQKNLSVVFGQISPGRIQVIPALYQKLSSTRVTL